MLSPRHEQVDHQSTIGQPEKSILDMPEGFINISLKQGEKLSGYHLGLLIQKQQSISGSFTSSTFTLWMPLRTAISH
jgi:hypothetical protein